jgi:hypothetical protein
LRAVRLGNRQGTEIRVRELGRFPELVAWCREHAHLLKGHPAHENHAGKEALEPVGTYLAEALALPKREYLRILGRVPAGTRQRDLTLGFGNERRKRRLQVYTFEGTDL